MKLLDFLRKEIWHVQIATLPKWQAYWYRFLRVLLLTSRGFTKSQIQQGASSLTYYSLLAIVPVIALLIGVARGFAFEQTLQSWLLEQFSDQKEIITQVFTFANESLEEANGGLIAGIGILILIWSAVNILTNIEFVMNQIWEVDKGRSIAKQFTDYLAVFFLGPIIIFSASGLTGYLSALFTAMGKGAIFSHLVPLFVTLLSIATILLTGLLFTFLYIFIPNTRVRFIPAVIAGIFTAIAYQILQWAYVYFQIGVAKYNAIYGTFAAFPLFLIWLNLSWTIVLLGAKVCFSIQNVDAYEFISDEFHLSPKSLMICSLRIAHHIIKRLVNGLDPSAMIEISNALSIPLPLTTQLIHQLVKAKVLIEVKRDPDQDEAYLPALNVDQLTIKNVMDMISESGEVIPLPDKSKEAFRIMRSLKKFNDTIEKSEGNVLLKDI